MNKRMEFKFVQSVKAALAGNSKNKSIGANNEGSLSVMAGILCCLQLRMKQNFYQNMVRISYIFDIIMIRRFDGRRLYYANSECEYLP